MWRILFLLLVVLGGLTLLVTLVVGIGVARVASVQQDQPEPASGGVLVAATRPSGPATPARSAAGAAAPGLTPATTRPVEPGTRPAAAAADHPDPAAVPSPPAGPVRAPPARDPVAVDPAGRPPLFVPGTIVLRGADAKLHGKRLRRDPPGGDLTDWTRRDDYASWPLTPPAGRYHVDVSRSAAAGGGDFGIHLGAGERKSKPVLSAKAEPTGAAETFRTQRVGQLDFAGGPTTLSIRPAGDLDGPLMRFRRIELVPVDPPAVGANQPAAAVVAAVDGDGSPAVTGLTLVNARDGQPIGALTSGMALDLATLPPVSVRAEVAGRVGRVQFYEDGRPRRGPEGGRPFVVAGVRDGRYVPWTPVPGRHYLTAVPYPEPDAGGNAGRKHVVHLVIRSSAPIVLRASDAALHGDEIRLGGEPGRPHVGSWAEPKAYAEWKAVVPGSGRYTVEMLVARAAGDGGAFVLRADVARLGGKVSDTGGWDAYRWVTAGTVKLSRGPARVSIKADEPKGGRPLMNLREVRLVPTGGDAGDDE